MKKHLFFVFLLVVVLVFACSVSVWAKTDTVSGSYDVSFENSSDFYSQQMPGLSYEGGMKERTMTYTFHFDDDLDRLLDMGALEYRVDFQFVCGTSRTVSREVMVSCYDASGNMINDGQYSISEKSYIVPKTTFVYESDNILIPEKTKTIKVEATISVGSKQHMSISGNMYVYKNAEEDAYIDNTMMSNTQFTLKEYYDENDTTGSGWDINYYDIFENYSTRIPSNKSVELYKKAISNGGNLYYWSQYAYDLIKIGGNDNAYIQQNNDSTFDDTFGSYYFDFCDDMGHKTAAEIQNKNVYGSSSNLIHVTNFGDVLGGVSEALVSHRKELADTVDSTPLKAEKFTENHYLTKDGTKDGSSIVEGNTDILYTFVASTDRVGAEQKFDYNAFVIAFYDFEMVGVVDSENIEMSASFADKEPKITTYFNDNPTAGHAETVSSWSYSDNFTNTLTTGQTHTSSDTFGWNINVGMKFKLPSGGWFEKHMPELDVSAGVNGSYTTSEAYSFQNSEAKSETYTQNSSSSISTDMPAYTVAEIVSAETEGISTAEYDCPIAITYKVAVFSLNGRYYDDAAGVSNFSGYPHRTNVWLMGDDGGHAVKELRDRAKNNSLGSSDPMNWDKFRTLSAPVSSNQTNLLNGDALINRLALNIPFTYERATATLTGSYTTNSIKIYPCRPLYFTSISGINTNFLHRNDVIYTNPGGIYDITSNISVKGFNDQGGEYYGFNVGKGYWSLTYFGGDAVPESIAKIEKDPYTGKTVLTIGSAATSDSTKPIYLTYHINDGIYNYYDRPKGLTDTYINDSDLASRASLRVEIGTANVLSCTGDESCTLSAYTDVDTDAWYHTALEYAHIFGMMNGVSETEMAPDEGLTRAMFATILYRMADEPETDNSNPFRDFESTDYCYDAVCWAEEQDIIEGYSDGTFGGERLITREEMVTMTYRFALFENLDKNTSQDLNGYEDIDEISDFAKDAFVFAVEKGIVQGTSDTTLDPKDTATRAQVAKLIMNYYYNMN